MRISDVLRVKGGQVVTVTPDTDVRHLLTVLAEHRIGAVVVSHNGTSVDGIASERDIVRALAQRGAAVLSEPITAIYTAGRSPEPHRRTGNRGSAFDQLDHRYPLTRRASQQTPPRSLESPRRGNIRKVAAMRSVPASRH